MPTKAQLLQEIEELKALHSHEVSAIHEVHNQEIKAMENAKLLVKTNRELSKKVYSMISELKEEIEILEGNAIYYKIRQKELKSNREEADYEEKFVSLDMEEIYKNKEKSVLNEILKVEDKISVLMEIMNKNDKGRYIK